MLIVLSQIRGARDVLKAITYNHTRDLLKRHTRKGNGLKYRMQLVRILIRITRVRIRLRIDKLG